MSAPVAVAVVSWNTRDLLRACLRSLAPEAEAARAEVWVVDNASTDGSAALVTDAFPWVRLIASEENLGFGPAVNLVAGESESAWIAPSNADIELTPGALEALLSAGESDPEAGIVAPRLLLPDEETQRSLHPFPTVTMAAFLNLGLQRLVPRLGERFCLDHYWDADRPRRVDWAHAAFLLVRREAFEAVGGFDRRQWMYAEDLDLAWRLRRAGWRTRYEPTAAVRHELSAAARKAFAEERASRYMAATYAWMVWRRGIVITWCFAAVNVAGAALRWLAWAPLAAVGPRRFLHYRNHARRYLALHRLGLRRRSTLLQHR